MDSSRKKFENASQEMMRIHYSIISKYDFVGVSLDQTSRLGNHFPPVLEMPKGIDTIRDIEYFHSDQILIFLIILEFNLLTFGCKNKLFFF